MRNKTDIKTIIKRLLQAFLLLFACIYLADVTETLAVFVVYALYLAFMRYGRKIKVKDLAPVETYSAIPLLLLAPLANIHRGIGLIPAVTYTVLMVTASFVIRMVLLQRRTKKMRWHNTTMLVVFGLMLVCFELTLGESKLGPQFQMRNAGVEYTVSKTLFWAPKDFREKLFLHSKEYLIDDLMQKKQEGRNIYFFGGSATAGAFLDDVNDAFPTVLEKRLGDEFPNASIRVVNAGVGGYTTFQIRKIIETHIDDIDADLFAFYVGRNDTTKTYGRYTHKEIFEILHGGQDSEGGPGAVGLLQTTLGKSHLYNFFVNTANHLKENLQGTAMDITVRAVPIEDMIENFDVIKRLCDAKKIRMVIFAEAVNDPQKLPEVRQTHQALQQWAEKNNVPFLDTHTLLWETANHATLFIDDVHLNPSGHKVVTEMMLRFLEEKRLVKD